MRWTLRGSHVAGVVIAAALVALAVTRTGYGQGQSAAPGLVPIVSSNCQPFQQTLAVDVIPSPPVSSGQIRITPGATITIEQIALRLDALDNVVTPIMAAVTTTVRANTSTYYVPMRADVPSVMPGRPLTLMQAGPLHADGGTNVTLTVVTDPNYTGGRGRAEWSISGRACGSP